MVGTTVTDRPPGSAVRRVSSETRLFTVTVTLTQAPAEFSDPDDGDAATLPTTAAGTLITKSLTGPPAAVRRNVPVALLPWTAVSTSSVGAAAKVPWLARTAATARATVTETSRARTAAGRTARAFPAGFLQPS